MSLKTNRFSKSPFKLSTIVIMFSIQRSIKITKICSIAVIPWQVTPFPWKPVLHVQLKDPLVFIQLAFTSQLCVPKIHSSISMIKEKEQNYGMHQRCCYLVIKVVFTLHRIRMVTITNFPYQRRWHHHMIKWMKTSKYWYKRLFEQAGVTNVSNCYRTMPIWCSVNGAYSW